MIEGRIGVREYSEMLKMSPSAAEALNNLQRGTATVVSIAQKDKDELVRLGYLRASGQITDKGVLVVDNAEFVSSKPTKKHSPVKTISLPHV